MRHLLIHTAVVTRSTRTITSATASTSQTWSTPFAALRCRILPTGTTMKSAILGRSEQDEMAMTWGSETLLPGDRVAWDGRVFLVRKIQDCRNLMAGPGIRFQTAELEQKK